MMRAAVGLPCAGADVRVTVPADARCEETVGMFKSAYICCGDQAVAAVYHPKDGRRYFMCAACADHNLRNRGGILVSDWPDWRDR